MGKLGEESRQEVHSSEVMTVLGLRCLLDIEVEMTIRQLDNMA